MNLNDIVPTVINLVTDMLNLESHKIKDYVDEQLEHVETPIIAESIHVEGVHVHPVTKNVGIKTKTPICDLHVNGSFAASTKSFIIDHPTKPGKKLRYGSLEGPENGVYVRGRVAGHTITLPDYWRGLVDETTITVHLTPIGSSKTPSVERIYDNKIYLRKSIVDDTLFVDCFYVVYGERKDVKKFEVEF